MFYEIFSIGLALSVIASAPIIKSTVNDVYDEDFGSHGMDFMMIVFPFFILVVGAWFKTITGDFDDWSSGTDWGYIVMTLFYMALWVQIGVKKYTDLE